MSTNVTEDFVETISPKGYVNNREITNLPGHFLVKGSINTQIVNGEKVVSAKRYILKGAPKTVNNGIEASYDWRTSTKVYRNIRQYMLGGLCETEVLYKGDWKRVKRAFKKANFEWAEVWDNNELIDLLIGVNGTDKMYMWSGGLSEVASVTANTITKKGYVEDDDIYFEAATRKIKKTSGGFTLAGFTAGMTISISGTVDNDGEYEILTVADTEIVVTDKFILTDSGVGAMTVVKVTGEGTWAEARFLVTTAGRAVIINGKVYTYTGGENTGTLTGVSPSPVTDGVVEGDFVAQDIVETAPLVLQDRNYDLISVDGNHVFVGSTLSREVFISKNTDYDDFGYTTPLRKPGEGFKLTLDASPVGFAPSENDNMSVTAGDDYWYEVTMTLSAEQGTETVEVKRLKTSPGQAAVSQSAIAFVKNSVAFLSKERIIDTISNIENIPNQQAVPISDDIKNDLEEFDVTDAHLLYHKRSLFVCLPKEGLVLEYDTRFGYWQPPQEFPVARLAIIDGELCGHSRGSNETYQLYTGYNSLSASTKYVAAFGYENFGARFSLKNFTKVGIEAYLSRTTELTETIYYDYQGARDTRSFLISGADEKITFAPSIPAGLGAYPLGSQPLGSLITPIPELVKVRAIDRTPRLDFFERQRVFSAEGEAVRFEIIAYGENVKMSDNEPSFITR